MALRDDAPAELAGAGAEIDHVVRAADGVLVVLDDHQRVALGFQLLQHIEQDLVVAVMQPDGRLVEDVADAAQVRRRTVERQVAEPHLAQEAKARAELGDEIARDLTFTSLQFQLGEAFLQHRHRQPAKVRDVLALPQHGERLGIEPLALARLAGLVDLEPLDPRIEHVVLGAGLRALLVPLDFLDREPGAVAGGAPAVLRVIRKQSRIQLREAAPARPAGALGREHLHVLLQHVHHAFAELERSAQCSAQRRVGLCLHLEREHRQLDRVLLEAIDAREGPHRHQLAVDAQVPVALARGPLRQIGVEAFAIQHQGREQRDFPAAVFAHQARGDQLLALRLDRNLAFRAVLRAQLHE